ncbi:hypothetical protein PsorP6_017855 [Peronosclerospora sorghi]|uniref:Uncharacterized protein n=1 Tax=Peronosclerospora sorghi TaxID=230839 RepID=A0ACC0WC81_9STRA|nr:hypothetical protein PsorP6_017855 [Peronosclerospora sorghi]
MNTILDLFVAVRIAAGEDENLSQGLAMLLDFAKAIRLSQPASPLRGAAIPRIPRQLRAACGNLAREHEVPLPSERLPVLLYEKIDNTTELEGVVFSSRSKQINVKICGYADDTAVYVRSPQKVSSVLDILAQFGTASGLPANASRSMAITIRSGVVIDPAFLGEVKLLRDGEHCRYVGIQVSVGEATKANWEACIRSINAHLARSKTNTVVQRAALAAAVIVPKIVFVARHV